MKKSEMIDFLRKNIDWVDETPNWAKTTEIYKCDVEFASYIIELVEKAGMLAPYFDMHEKDSYSPGTIYMGLEFYADEEGDVSWEPEDD